MTHSQEFPLSKGSIHTRFGCIVVLFLLSSANEWTLETCMFLSQLFEISLNPGDTRDLWWLWRGIAGLLGVNGGSEPARRLRIRIAKFVAIQTRPYPLDLSSSHPYQPLVLISTAQCVAGLRRKRTSANVRTLSLGSAGEERKSPP